MMRPLYFLSVSLLVFASCGDSKSSRPRAAKGEFVALMDIAETSEEQNRVFDLTRNIRAGFDFICPDTFCEGDFENLTALQFDCSVSKVTKQIKDCRWIFAGAFTDVDGKTGEVKDTTEVFRCSIPVTGSKDELLELLAPAAGPPNDDALLQLPLPGSQVSLMDALIDCF